jgi:hypothetical protein
MLRQIGIVAALLLPTSAALVFAGDYPRVIYPIGHTLPADAQGSVKVQVPLLQIEIRPGLILSASRGADIQVRPSSEPSGSQDLLIQGGAITAIDLLTNDVAVLPPGSYRVSSITVSAPSGISPQQALAESNPISSEVDVMSPSFRLSDAILTQQQKYLDSLKIDVKDINKMLASIIRGLVPRRP